MGAKTYMIRSIVNRLASAKSWLSPLLILCGAIAVLAGWHSNPAPLSAISNVVIHADYVGPLQARLRARGIGGGTMGLGYGMMAGSRYVVFSKTLDLGDEDIQRIRAAGAPYQVGLHQNAIVTV